MLTFINLGKMGRLGNQMFQIASTIGIAKWVGTKACFPKWDYMNYCLLPFVRSFDEKKYT